MWHLTLICILTGLSAGLMLAGRLAATPQPLRVMQRGRGVADMTIRFSDGVWKNDPATQVRGRADAFGLVDVARSFVEIGK